ncbi:hypothetical protein OOT46_29205 [Aquabacterium sp. A7-Y]|uniref:hypothetical protein n=1 Tax=Aquabacterium sp. A7-Y TaxID=1349605 RepID=UPI00223CDE62|nr:hypothetical protein [Aquabacterium sp. A7-Y]MCW7541880.1 hypothetical protein [Aquabacterium sp. A7-Y]
MTVYAWREAWLPQRFRMVLQPNERVHTSPYTQGEQVIDLLGERWHVEMTLAERRPEHGAALEAFFARLRGSAHQIRLWHFRRPVPRGTLRGSPVLGTAVAQGAAVVTIDDAGAGATLLEGDLIGLSGQLLMVAEDAVANAAGEMTVHVSNRLRAAVASGTAVIWDRPTTEFRLMSPAAPGYRPRAAEAMELEFREHWA